MILVFTTNSFYANVSGLASIFIKFIKILFHYIGMTYVIVFYLLTVHGTSKIIAGGKLFINKSVQFPPYILPVILNYASTTNDV